MNAALVKRDLYAKRLQEHVDAKGTDDWFRDGRSVSPIRTHANTEVFSMSKEPEKETVKTDTSYDSATSGLSRASTKYDSQHATSSQQQINRYRHLKLQHALMRKHHHFHVRSIT